jgi:hypothetical protein
MIVIQLAKSHKRKILTKSSVLRKVLYKRVIRDISVGIATRFGLDGPGIEHRWGATFSAPVQTGPVAHPDSYTMGTGCLSRK